LLYDREFVCVTDVIVRETNTKNICSFPELSHSKKASNLIILLHLLLITSLTSVAAEIPMPALVTQIFSGKLKRFFFSPLGPGSRP